MKRTDLENKLMAYADGELDAAANAELERALGESPELRAELEELHRISAFAQVAVLAPGKNVDLSGVYGNVMARIAAEERAATPSTWKRITTWLSEVVHFERPMVLVALGAAVLAVVVGASLSGSSSVPGTDAPTVATGTGNETGAPKRRGAEEEVKAMSRNTAFVEKLEANKGKAFVEFDKNDPEAPMVLWHVIEDEGTAAPKGL